MPSGEIIKNECCSRAVRETGEGGMLHVLGTPAVHEGWADGRNARVSRLLHTPLF